MEDINLSSSSQLSFLELQCETQLQAILDRRSSGPIPPNVDLSRCNYDGFGFSRKYLDLVTLLIVLHFSKYFGDFREYLIYEIQKYLLKNYLFPELYASTISKELFSVILFGLTKVSKPRILFGTILREENVNRVLDRCKLKILKPSKVQRIVRHRGYRDHGTLRPSDRWVETHDYSLTELQLKEEEKFNTYLDQVDLLVRTAGTWVLRGRSFHLKGEDNG